MPENKGIPLRCGDKVYIIRPGFHLVREIEDELGSIAALHRSFAHDSWKVSDLAALVHMMLQAAGETTDYIRLGDQMMREGLGRYLSCARAFLQLVLHS